MSMSKRPSERHLQAIVDKFNADFPVGTEIDYTDDLGIATGYKTRSEAQVLGGHSAVIWLEGKSGCVSLSRISRREIR